MHNTVRALVLLALFLVGCKESFVGPPTVEGPKQSEELYYTVVGQYPVEVGVYAIKSDKTNRHKVVDNMGILSSPVGNYFIGMQDLGLISFPALCSVNGQIVNQMIIADGDYSILSPRGDKIVYRRALLSTDDVPGEELHVVDINGLNDVLIEPFAAAVSVPVWSPDGTRIAFFKKGDEKAGISKDSVFIVNTDGSGRRLVTTEAVVPNDNYEGLDWSPDGSKIVCITQTGLESCELLVVTISNGMERTITADGTSKVMPVWSPNGQKIAYMEAAYAQSVPDVSLITVNADGSNKKQYDISAPGFIALYPQWSPSSSLISFTEIDLSIIDETRGTLKVVNMSNGAITTLDTTIFRGYWRK